MLSKGMRDCYHRSRVAYEKRLVEKGIKKRSVRCNDTEYIYTRAFISFLHTIENLNEYVLDINEDDLVIKLEKRNEC